jgi:anti-sigma B factor antagonist
MALHFGEGSIPERNLADRDEPLRVQVHHTPARATMVLGGELDLWTAGKFRTHLDVIEPDPPSMIVIDLRGLAFMDSSGLAELVSATRRARAADRRVVLVTGSPPIDRVLAISGVLPALDTTPDPETLAG